MLAMPQSTVMTICTPLAGELAERFGVEAVAVFEPMRDVKIDVCAPRCLRHVEQDRGAGDAVDVVVAVDADFLLLFDGLKDAFDGLIDAWQRFGFMKSRKRGGQENSCSLRFADFAIPQKLSDDGRDVQALAERFQAGTVIGRQMPNLASGRSNHFQCG